MGIIDKVCGKIGLMDPEEDQADQVEEFLKEKAEMSEREFSGHQDRLENRMSSQNVVDFQNAASARDSAIAS